MIFPNPPSPPSTSPEALCGLKSDFPEEVQALMAGQDPGVNGNGDWNEANSLPPPPAPPPPSFTPFWHANNSPYPNYISPNNYDELPPELTAVRPPVQSGTPGDVYEANHHHLAPPSLTPFVHVANSPYHNINIDDDKLLDTPPDHTLFRPPVRSTNPHSGVNVHYSLPRPPGFTPFMHVTNSPYPNPNNNQVGAPSQLKGVSIPQQWFNRLLPGNSEWDDTFRILSCYACSSDKDWRPLVAHQKRDLTRALTVNQLDLRNALKLTVPETTLLKDAASRITTTGSAAVLLVIDSNEILTGILTFKDLRRRVIAPEIDISNTPVSEIMTKNPIFVSPHTLALEALQKMAQGKVTSLPVIENDKVIALFQLRLCEKHYMLRLEVENTNKHKEAAMKAIAQCYDLHFDAHSEQGDL